MKNWNGSSVILHDYSKKKKGSYRNCNKYTLCLCVCVCIGGVGGV